MLHTLTRLFDNLQLHTRSHLNFSETYKDDLVLRMLHASFSESGLELKEIIEEHYRDGIDGFEDVEVKGNIITGVFLDRVNATLTKKFKFTVTPDKTEYSLINPEDIENFQELDFAATDSRKKCTIGLSCGNSCVAQKTDDGKPVKCQQTNSPETKTKVNQILAKAPRQASNKFDELLLKAQQKAQERAANRKQNLENLKAEKTKKVSKESVELTRKQTSKPKPTESKQTNPVVNKKVLPEVVETKTEAKPQAKVKPTTSKTEEVEKLKDWANGKASTTIDKPQENKPKPEVNRPPAKSKFDVNFGNHKDLIGLGSSFADSIVKEFESGSFGNKFKMLSDASKKLASDKEQLAKNKARLRSSKAKGQPIDQALLAESRELSQKLIKNQEAFDRVLSNIGMRKQFEQLREDILNRHGITQEQAEKAVANMNFTGESLKNPQKLAKAKADIADVYRFTGGKGVETVKSITADQDRASANPIKGTLDMGKASDRAIVFHEFAHHVEVSVPGLAAASRDWVESRATSKTPQKLSEITGNKNYRDKEVALPDKFISPYIGKIYGKRGTPTEVISMGVERFHSAESMMNFYLQDPEHFKFTLGAILGEKPKTTKK